MSSERDSFAKEKFSTSAKGFLLHKLLLKVNYSPLRVKKSRSHDMAIVSFKNRLKTRVALIELLDLSGIAVGNVGVPTCL
jgi:hypothetical protein